MVLVYGGTSLMYQSKNTMKKLLFICTMFLGSIVATAQTGTGDGGDPGNPNPISRCGYYCFKNATDCELDITFISEMMDDPCTDEVEGIPGSQTVHVRPGETKCVDFGQAPDGCTWCPWWGNSISICGTDYPCGEVDAEDPVSATVIICGGQPYNITIVNDGGGHYTIKH